MFQEFMLCRMEEKDPRKCLAEGKAVTACTMDFFRKVKGSCLNEFNQYANCIDKSSGDYSMVKWVVWSKLCLWRIGRPSNGLIDFVWHDFYGGKGCIGNNKI